MSVHLTGTFTAGAPPVGRATRMPCCASQGNPNFFRPSLRSGLKQRQEAAMREKMGDKQKKWEEWEAQVEAEERARREAAAVERRPPPPLFPSAPAQRAFQDSDQARAATDQQLDDFQRGLAERVRQRRRRSDRWLPPQTDEVVAERAAAERARAEAREARRRAAEEAAAREAADAAAAAQFLRGRVRQKASRFAELVGTLQESQAERDPYRRRDDDEEGVAAAAAQGRRRRQPPQAEPRWAGAQPAEPYLPPDVIRVEREAYDDDVAADGGVWVAATDGAGLQRAAVEERWVQEEGAGVVEVWEEGDGGRWASAPAAPPEAGSSGPARGSASDDEYIDW